MSDLDHDLEIATQTQWDGNYLTVEEKQDILIAAGLEQFLALASGPWDQIISPYQELLVRLAKLGLIWYDLSNKVKRNILKKSGLNTRWSVHSWIAFDNRQKALIFKAAQQLHYI